MSNNTTVAVMDQYSDATAGSTNSNVHMGLSHVSLPAGDNAKNVDINSTASVALAVQPLIGLLLLRATDGTSALSDALLARCGVALSARLQSTSKGEYCVRWMSPDSWLLSCPVDKTFAIENDLRKAVSAHVAIVNVSGGYTVLELSGAHARDVLMKSTGYDVHPDHLSAGKVVNTTFAKAQVTLRCVDLHEGQGRYELIVRRSFSDYVWLWIQRASAEYGLHATNAG